MRKTKPKFVSAEELDKIIAQYFEWIKGEYHVEQKEIKGVLTDQIIWDREPEPSTIAGLAFHLGFSSLKQMERYETTGKHSEAVQRGRLRIMADYEKKLHTNPSSGAIFALKGLGWNEQNNNELFETANIKLKAEIITSGPPLASSEQDVVL